MPEFKKYKPGKSKTNHPVLRNPALMLLLENVREDNEYTNNQQVSILGHLFFMKLRDENILEEYARRLAKGQFTKINHVTQILYWFAKFKWRSATGDHYL